MDSDEATGVDEVKNAVKQYQPSDYTGPSQLVHLHNHTVFSTLDGVSTPEQYAEQCFKRGYPAMSATEHGTMGSVPDMYFAFKKYGLKYIPGCFLKNQPIYVIDGVKEIGDVVAGDKALTHLTNFQSVKNLQIRDYDGDLIRIKAWGVEDQICTPEHPFLIREVLREETRRGVWSETITVDWRYAKDISRQTYHRTYSTKRSNDRSNKRRFKHYLCVPRLPVDCSIDTIALAEHIFSEGQTAHVATADNLITSVTYKSEGYTTTKQVNLPISLDLCEELLWIMGLWLAEGSADEAGPHFSLCSDEYHFYERIAAYFAVFGINVTCHPRDGDGESRPRAALDVQVYSVYFGRLFSGLFGTGFANKQLPPIWLMELSSDQARALVDGVFDGDAKIGLKQSFLKLNNRTLVWQIRMLMTKYEVPQHSAVTPIPCNNSDNISYILRRRESGHFYYDYDDKFVYLPVYDVQRESYNGKVYNIEVENDNSYFTGVAVHNCEIYFNDYDLERKDFLAKGGKINQLKQDNPALHQNYVRNRHLTVLAKNEKGFSNLVKLTTQAYETGYYYRPRVWFDKLCEYKEGLIILSGCLNGPVSHELRRTTPEGESAPCFTSKDKRGAINWIKRFKSAFGDDYKMELQMPKVPGDEQVFRTQIDLADMYGLELNLANDCHYLERRDFELQHIMMAIDQQTTINDPNMFHVNSDEQFMKTRAELWATFKNYGYSNGVPDSVFETMCDNTIKTAEQCEAMKFDGTPKIPSFDKADDRLAELVISRLKQKGHHKIKKRFLIDGREVTYLEQAAIELERIVDKGYSSYFLITHELIGYGTKRGWPFSPRGSAGGSYINHLLGISPINPLPWQLSFDRFLSPSRGGYLLKVNMPDPIVRLGKPVEKEVKK